MIGPEGFDVFDELEEVDNLEDVDDIAAFDAAIAEGGEGIPWDQVLEEFENGR